MFAGSELQSSPIPDTTKSIVLQERTNSLLVWPDPKWPNCYRLLRTTHPFEADDVRIVTQFIRALREKLGTSGEPFFHYLVDKCSQDAVACSVQHRTMGDDLLPTILTMLKKWASETYEGQRISVAIGVDPSPQASRISNLHLEQIIDQDFAKVLSNGLDTLLVLSPSGHVVEHLALGETTNDHWLAPRRYLPIANWASGGRVAFTLNRHGEILVFKSSKLQFAYRRGKWSHFAHSAMIARMAGSSNGRLLMRAVYASCLDISFSRTGGCIAVAKRNRGRKHLACLSNDDLLSLGSTDKSALLSHLTSRPFNEIPRAIREEMAALDGAIVLKALSRLGLAVKVSSDGGITAFTDHGTRNNPEIAFEVCV